MTQAIMELLKQLNQLTNEIYRLNELLTGGVAIPDAWDPKSLAAHYKISVRQAEKIVLKHGVKVGRTWRLPDWKRIELEKKPLGLTTF